MSPEGWEGHSLTEVIFSTLPAFNVIDLARSPIETSLNRKDHVYWCVGVKTNKRNEREEPPEKKRKEKKREKKEKKSAIYSTDAVKDVKWYPRLYVPYSSVWSGNVFDDIQFTVMAAAPSWWHQWSDDRRLQLQRHLSIHQVFAYFTPNVLFISGAIFPSEIINFTSAGIKSQ